jgi:hypothetical protein
MSYGAQIKFGLARQASANSWVTTATSYHGFAMVSEDVGLEKEELISQNLIGQFEEGAVYDGVNRVLGVIEFEATPRNIHAALAAAVNHSPVSVSSDSIRTLTFLPNTQDFSSVYVKAPWSVYKQFSDAASAELFYDCQMGQLEFTVANGQFLRGRLTVNGGTRLSTGIGSMNVMPDAADVGRLFPWNVCSISLGGSAIGDDSEITISLNEQIEGLYTNNASTAPFKFTRTGFRQVTASGRFYMTDRNILNRFAAGTQGRLVVTLMNTLAAVQSGYYNMLQIDIPQLKFTVFKPGASGPGEVSADFQARGVVDPTSRYALQFTTITTYQAGF